MMDLQYLPAGINGVLSLAIIFVCICRSAKITPNVIRRVKVSYVAMVMGAAANGASPWLLELPGWPSVAFAGCVFYMLNPDYIMILFRDPAGKFGVVVAVILQLIGFLWIRKIVDIEI